MVNVELHGMSRKAHGQWGGRRPGSGALGGPRFPGGRSRKLSISRAN